MEVSGLVVCDRHADIDCSLGLPFNNSSHDGHVWEYVAPGSEFCDLGLHLHEIIHL